jgi:hypothetical protein
LSRSRCTPSRGRDRLGSDDGLEEILDARSREWSLPAEHLVEQDPDGEDVGLGRDRETEHLLGRHVSGRSGDRAGKSIGRGLHVECDAEVDDPRAPGGVDDDVSWLEVAMDDAARVGGGRGARDVCRDAYGAPRHHRPLAQDRPEVDAFDELHRVVGLIVERVADVEDAHDARIADLRGDERLLPQLLRILGDRLRVDLDRDEPIEAMLERFPDDAHAAPPEEAHQIVSGDARRDVSSGFDGSLHL